MGRPKKFNHDEVLLAAETCFWNDGIRLTSISSLVESMNIQRSSFYNSFQSRNNILELVLEKYFEKSPLLMLFPSAYNQPSTQYLSSFFIEFSKFLAHNAAGRGCLFLNGLSELSPRDGLTFEIFHDRYLKMVDDLNRIISTITDFPHPQQGASNHQIQQVMMILMGLNHYSKLDQNEERLIKLTSSSLTVLSPDLGEAIYQRWAQDRHTSHDGADKSHAIA